jgi:predicted phosphodiesterase
MKILVISDVHSNLTALEAVIQNAGDVDAVWCMGDLVGYGPDPNECVERIRSLPGLICVKGNHDNAVCDLGVVDQFNEDAGTAIMLTREKLTKVNLDYLSKLPESVQFEPFTLSHGSPRNPIWEYIMDSFTAMVNFASMSTASAIVGHSHIPLMFAMDMTSGKVSRSLTKPKGPVNLKPRVILNPGSVGQPRDNDSRASYAILDNIKLTWENFRVEYDIVSVQQRILTLGFPARQALRLADGW